LVHRWRMKRRFASGLSWQQLSLSQKALMASGGPLGSRSPEVPKNLQRNVSPPSFTLNHCFQMNAADAKVSRKNLVDDQVSNFATLCQHQRKQALIYFLFSLQKQRTIFTEIRFYIFRLSFLLNQYFFRRSSSTFMRVNLKENCVFFRWDHLQRL
jgi:hypothetical protein